MSKKPEHTRLTLIRWDSFVLCRVCGGLKKIKDVYQRPEGLVYLLECGCQRQESA